MAEQLICNQQVGGSTPFTSSISGSCRVRNSGGIPERPKGADCKSVVTDFGGPNPPSPTRTEILSIIVGRIFVLYYSLFNIHHSFDRILNIDAAWLMMFPSEAKYYIRLRRVVCGSKTAQENIPPFLSKTKTRMQKLHTGVFFH